ncbi:MAG: hypothetical protein ABJE66_20925 [Deltaproteobacteria bacterium]
MSETIAIKLSATGAPEFLAMLDAISEALHIGDLRCTEDVPGPDTPWPHGIWHLFREGVSTRTTEITVDESEFAIRMFSMASHEDVALAVALAEYVAEHAGAERVDSEQAGELTPDEMTAYYTVEWADQQLVSGHGVLSALVRDRKETIEIPGPHRSFCLGPRVLLQLGPDKPHLRLLEAIRRVQWIPVRTAGTFLATAKSDQREVKLAVWLGEEVVFPAVDYAGISADPNAEKPEVFLIPAARVPELAAERWTAIDERQGLIEDFGNDWPALVEAARKFETAT